ncbi:probable mediator of RNA polymerase II transcription subunit 26a [Ananas comosus]|uniref:Probable mediator of RNA polymerase II transcription subunit 26a n=1 Tax=Ananas comosus TaxID=4615 RepID=A0A6P5GZI0_ANACO|nr:probable mediator of RNA polymerase II transcription subunit 26a [Ananas comosus]
MSSCGSLDYWRNVFNSTERSIFEIIEMSIAVAAADCPDELVRRRDGIVKSLYSFPSVAAGRPEEEAEQQQQQPAVSFCCSSGGSQKSSSEEEADDELQDAIDDAFALLDEVLRLKKILDNKNEENESSLFESLRRLQLMELTVSTLTATEIENSVRGVEGHGSLRVRQLARALLDGWAEFGSDSSNVTEAVADAPDTAANPSDDPWVNFPPLDEGALRAINGPPIDLDELFSENPRKIRKFKRDGVERADDRSETPSRSAGPHNTLTERGRTINASSKTSGKDLKRYLKRCAETMEKDDCELANEPSAVAKMTWQQCPTDDLLVEAKLEASRMRIREGYNQAKDEKKRRRIQLLDLHDIPKPVSSMKACKSMARRDRRGFTNRWRR